jgi:transketolase
MRNEFCQSMIDAATNDQSLVFLTGDLGFKALEPLRDRIGRRFINAGVAEQNMVSVAAGLARAAMRPWAYSIAPFIFARPFEQIRNDICLHELPVRLVGNGGGYGYGVMGATHHALEDYGTMLSLQGMHAFIPAFGPDVNDIVRKLVFFDRPAYLRLGLAEEPKDLTLPAYAPWRKIVPGKGSATVLGIGPVISKLIASVRGFDAAMRPSVWVLTELPFDHVPLEFVADVKRSGHLIVIEEHVARGGAGQLIAHALLAAGKAPRRFSHRCAEGYVSGRYGSQAFHRKECGLDAESIVAELLTPRKLRMAS